MNNIVYQAPVNMETKDHAHVDQHVLGGPMPWFFNATQTPLIETDYLVPQAAATFFWSHTMCLFDEKDNATKMVSDEFHFFHRKFKEWHEENNIKYTEIFRACINLNVHFPVDYSVPHVDHFFPHQNWLWYLETVEDAQTLLFDDDLNISLEVDCVKDTAVSFDGSIRHAHRYPPIGRTRRIVVFTYI